MKNEQDLKLTLAPDTDELKNRREALKKLGKYSAYVAPFTVLALSQKAQAATGHGGAGKHH